MKRYLPLAVFSIALSISLYYNFTTNYLTVYDAARGYELYNYYRGSLEWEPMSGLYGLQNTAVLSNYIPAWIQAQTGLSPEPFFKWYIAIGIAFVPVTAYFIARKFVNQWYAVIAALFIMGWVAFYQGGSYARSNFAMVIYGGLILVILSNWKARYKYPISAILAGSLSFAHYGATIVAFMVVGGLLCLSLVRRYRQSAKYFSVILLVLVISMCFWHGVVNQSAWKYLSLMVEDTIMMAKLGASSSEIQRVSGEVMNTEGSSYHSPVSIMSRDKIIQAAFGVKNPDKAEGFTLNWWLFGFAWLTVVLMSYGAYKVLRGDYPLIYKWLVFLSFCAIALTVIVPQISRGYGIEKVYYQAIIVTAPCFVIGGQYLAKRLHLQPYILLGAVLLPYIGLMWKYGVITSIF